MLLANSAGNKSVSYTFVVVGFVVVTLWLLASIATDLGPIHIRAFNAGDAMAYFVPLLTLYYGRRWASDGKAISGSGQTDDAAPSPSNPT